MNRDKLAGRQTVSVLNTEKPDTDPRGAGQDSPMKSYASLPWELWAGWQGPQVMGLLSLHRASSVWDVWAGKSWAWPLCQQCC